jgi:SNF2 family DNA or RNA helicase
MLDGKAAPGNPVKTTLIVAPPTLLKQWMQEMEKHVKDQNLGRILSYHSGSRLESNSVISDLMEYDVILTTYGEVQKSYPVCDPPKHLASEEGKNEWWRRYYQENVGPLHRIKFHRVVLDEAHHIKNHKSKTSIAVRALTGTYKWCITGTPILNHVEEFFPYFSFLRVPHTGDFATFSHNYCSNRAHPREPIGLGRLHNMLRSIMLRRTHEDTLFNAPIVKLPGITHNTVLVEFSPVERKIYNMVKSKCANAIKGYSTTDSLTANYSHILTMLLRLRMLCSHIMACRHIITQTLDAADIESLWRMTSKEVQPQEDCGDLNIVQTLRRDIATGKNFITTTQTKVLPATPAPIPDGQNFSSLDSGGGYGLRFRFRKFIRILRDDPDAWAEVHLRSVCAKCRGPPDDPVCTSCFHVYCQECILALHSECKERGESKTACLECQAEFEESTRCRGLEELGFGDASVQPMIEKKRAKLEKQKNRARQPALGTNTGRRSSLASSVDDDEAEPERLDWLSQGGAMLSSAKLTAAKAAILNWKEKHATQKIIVYTQFLDVGTIFGAVCDSEGWGYVDFNGKMSMDKRSRAIEKFRDDADIFIMICSLKAGGVGLNLTMASKVIILDLWFNSSVEAQAYCRAFRIGQESVVDVLRFVVKDSIDEDLIKMQERKDIEVNDAIGPENLKKRCTIQDLIELFRTEDEEEGEDEDGNRNSNNNFILVEDSDALDEFGDDVDPMTRLPPRPF